MERHARRGRGGFTLIEILIVIAIIAVLAGVLLPRILGATDTANVEACKQNLRNVAESLQLYRMRFHAWPDASGPAFLLELWEKEMVEHTPEDSLLFLCPGVGRSPQRNDGGEAYTDLSYIDPDTIDYAGRNVEDYPIPRHKKAPIASDDNDGVEPNHRFQTNVLWSDWSVTSLDIADYPGEETLVVGPDSPAEELRELSSDG